MGFTALLPEPQLLTHLNVLGADPDGLASVTESFTECSSPKATVSHLHASICVTAHFWIKCSVLRPHVLLHQHGKAGKGMQVVLCHRAAKDKST